MADDKKFEFHMPNEYVYDGQVLTRDMYTEDILDRIKVFDFALGDVLLSTCPKAGTTWLQEILYLVCNNADTAKAKERYMFERVPFIESTLPLTPNEEAIAHLEYLLSQEPPRLIKTHLPPSFYKRGLQLQSKAKVIVGVRNPKDTLVSLYNFYKLVFSNFSGTWDQFFEHLYKKKRLVHCEFFEFYEGWWRYKTENPDQVLFVQYEDLKRDISAEVRKIAAFLGKSLTDEQVATIKEHTTFDAMKKNEKACPAPQWVDGYFRKGQVGDWVNYFSQDQSDYVEKEANEKLKPLGLDVLC